jgi:hypothetical protein
MWIIGKYVEKTTIVRLRTQLEVKYMIKKGIGYIETLGK